MQWWILKEEVRYWGAELVFYVVRTFVSLESRREAKGKEA